MMLKVVKYTVLILCSLLLRVAFCQPAQGLTNNTFQEAVSGNNASAFEMSSVNEQR